MSKPYHRVGVGCGGVFEFPLSTDDDEPIYTIGTTGCKYCVGIYVPLSDTKCFAAHIFACCDDPDDHNIRTAKHGYWVPNGTEGTELITKVGELLDEHLDDCLDDGYLSPEQLTALASRAIVVCPCLKKKVDDVDEQEMDASGAYILEALNAYFHTTFTAESAHGFAVNHNTGEYDLFRFAGSGGVVEFEPAGAEVFAPLSGFMAWTMWQPGGLGSFGTGYRS
ncbi:hypothetical protein M409DRAFT_23069 [Zasmidium cellare ATCC 36951]|uniref:Uncharacterized protein n=1 Tax=Zasmidium cellare ATCC 36951 TaxID=1080233 RepID=A0A6A6CLW4_ZASCE|nr:uncharacterized protein M409DRAFT_23069 [Zasmidium cellare ATCC 36951]KAF2166426.1 hypothetical protein M409DRAFT_23069 [Zasmidium cellare ATCC 36951]